MEAEAQLVPRALALLNNPAEQQKLSASIGQLALPNADEDIAEQVIQIINANK